ncbi:MAG: hypothetical protein M0D55_13300 [Elusimicrobiota bacterium]|nr:MAG: hypothetical protein M0D55_13300 [Elusimicrobiota bacterium]
MMRSFLALLLALSPLSSAAQIKNPDTFVYATIGDPESFDPAWSYDTASHNILANVYEYLLSFKGGGPSSRTSSRCSRRRCRRRPTD